jgi:hypothetical protein
VISPILAAILSWAACLPPPGDAPPAEDRPDAPLAALAGDYDLVDGFNRCSITLKPEGRFTFVLWGSCVGPCDQNKGVAKVVSGRLILTPEGPNERGKTKGMDTRFVPVRWGGRHYLVPEGRGQDFCYQVNSRGRSYAVFGTLGYLRRGDEELKVVGLPEVPKDWEPMLLKTPLDGQVVEVLVGDRARVDLGSERGIRQGMVLWVITGSFHNPHLVGIDSAEVVEVGTKTCVVKLGRPMDSTNLFKQGQKVFSQLRVVDR